jgi:hypothetical protein
MSSFISQDFFFTELAKIMKDSKSYTNVTGVTGGTGGTDVTDDNSNKNIIISSDSTSNNDDLCLISKEKLHPNHITLSCNHKFNYIPIYKEVSYQKNKNNTSFEITKLLDNEIKCPYCRRITPRLIPYIPYPSVKQTRYVNSPEDLCMPAVKCQHVLKKTHTCDSSTDLDLDLDDSSAKCEKNALYYEDENLLLCVQHFRQYEKRMKSIRDKKAKENAKIQEKLAKQSSIPRCKAILKCGKNTGKCCDRIISIDGASFCKIHS